MYILYCDGSTKQNNNIVVSVMATKLSLQYKRIEQVIYCYKELFTPKNKDINELLAGFVALRLIKELELENERVMIINDNISNIGLLRNFKNGIQENSKFQEVEIINAIKDIQSLDLSKVQFKQLRRTTIGMNLVDFLNYEENTWVRDRDKRQVELSFDKIINRPYNFDISSKRQKENRKKNRK